MDNFHTSHGQPCWFKAPQKVLVLDPSSLKAPGFLDIRDLYRLRTPNRYFLLRVTPEMEIRLRFLLTSVRFRGQSRHQACFARKFLCALERETLICHCAHHPSCSNCSWRQGRISVG